MIFLESAGRFICKFHSPQKQQKRAQVNPEQAPKKQHEQFVQWKNVIRVEIFSFVSSFGRT